MFRTGLCGVYGDVRVLQGRPRPPMAMRNMEARLDESRSSVSEKNSDDRSPLLPFSASFLSFHDSLFRLRLRLPSRRRVRKSLCRRAVNARGGDAKEIVLKAQILAGGRGKGLFDSGLKGGVHLTKDPAVVGDLASKMLGFHLTTKQTPKEGVKVKTVMVAEALDISRETYFAILMDRSCNGPVMVGSPQGGMDIEEVADRTPELIFKETIDIFEGVRDDQAQRMAANLGFRGPLEKQAAEQMKKLYELFVKVDATQVEVNPLGETPEGQVVCFDAKINFDDNAEFRQKTVFAMDETDESDPMETEAAKYDLKYIGLDGNIACFVNGAGLAMATCDIIDLHGGKPANFLDLGGGVKENQVYAAFKLLTGDPKSKDTGARGPEPPGPVRLEAQAGPAPIPVWEKSIKARGVVTELDCRVHAHRTRDDDGDDGREHAVRNRNCCVVLPEPATPHASGRQSSGPALGHTGKPGTLRPYRHVCAFLSVLQRERCFDDDQYRPDAVTAHQGRLSDSLSVSAAVDMWKNTETESERVNSGGKVENVFRKSSCLFHFECSLAVVMRFLHMGRVLARSPLVCCRTLEAPWADGVVFTLSARLRSCVRDIVKSGFLFRAVPDEVEAILVNIFGGIVNCAIIANGITKACRELELKVPLVVRLEGTNVKEAKRILAESGLSITAANDLDDAAQKAVAAITKK
ncbi:hypothetical protein P4O66_006407 [Electrophorus voltai]|uniref:succinate--CoA ligase (GDP-forming) n=1 Tax=Electrophorus voltai TaxID=2609070 RepID=A0AAD9DY64_9TELE|nr:hypothetical protein P4O66_006407 [Electrophorus voltai]